MSYSVGYIEEAVRCLGKAQREDPKVSASALWSHLEGRCGCHERCPFCNNPNIDGMIVHHIDCPAVSSVPGVRIRASRQLGGPE